MKLLELYEHILNYAGVIVNKDGSTSISIAGRSEPALINGHRLMMPNSEVLHSSDKDIVIFHPFQEYVNRGESDVVRKLRRIINVRLNLAITGVMDGLLRLLESPGDHKRLDHQQREILTSVTAGKLKNANGESVLRAKLASLVGREFPEKPDNLCCNVFMKKSGYFKGEKHQRIGVVSFGFYEALERNASHFNKEQLATLEQLFEFIFPDSKEASTEAWNGFSDSAECPWLDCLLKSSYNVVSRLRELTNLYAEFMTSPETGEVPDELIFDVSWVDEIDNLRAYKQEILLIPSQAGNEGSLENQAVQPQTNKLADAALSAANSPVRAATPNVAQPSWQANQQPVQQMNPMQMPVNNGMVNTMQPPAQKMTSDGRIDLSGPNGFPTQQQFFAGSGVTGPVQQQMMMQNMQQQMMMNPGLAAAYANNGLLPMQMGNMMQPMMPMHQMQPMLPMMPNSLMAGVMQRPLPQMNYGVPGLQAPGQQMMPVSGVHNV